MRPFSNWVSGRSAPLRRQSDGELTFWMIWAWQQCHTVCRQNLRGYESLVSPSRIGKWDLTKSKSRLLRPVGRFWFSILYNVTRECIRGFGKSGDTSRNHLSFSRSVFQTAGPILYFISSRPKILHICRVLLERSWNEPFYSLLCNRRAIRMVYTI
jgi:hypothetical protein